MSTPVLLHLLLLLLLSAARSGEGACPSDPHRSPEVVFALAPGLKALACVNNQTSVWPTGDRVLLAHCDQGIWEHDNTTCNQSSDGKPLPVCDATKIPTPNNTNATLNLSDSQHLYAVYYQCVEPMSWLSGQSGRITQCINGNWTPIFDICDYGCPLCRDCGDIAMMGFTQTGVYRVVPSGNYFDPSIQVWCDLNNTLVDGGSGWTTVLRQYANQATFNLPLINYTTPIGNPNLSATAQPTSYFIGLDALTGLNWQTNGTYRPLIMEVILTDSAGKQVRAAYNNFQISQEPNYTLLSLGNYYGDAGNAFEISLGYNFVVQNGTFWWLPNDTSTYQNNFLPAGGSVLTSSSIKWYNLTLASVVMRTVSVDYDKETFCPLVFVNTSWTTVNVTVPLNRSVGALINYTCIGNLMVEGTVKVTTKGTVLCQAGNTAAATTPAWNYTLSLPCTLKCPNGTVMANTQDRCFSFSTQPSQFGLAGAALGCSRQQATLAVLTEPSDLDNATSGLFYYTAHNSLGGMLSPVLPSNITCSSQCSVSTGSECVAASKNVMYRTQSCSRNDTDYMCMIPGWCPTNYTLQGGLCYRLISSVSNLTNAEAQCELDGATLAYPESNASLTILAKMAAGLLPANNTPTASTPVIIALNDAWGNWTAGGLYSPSPVVIQLAGTSMPGYHWRVLTPYNSSARSPFGLINTTLAGYPTATRAICQLYGSLGCVGGPPSVSSNMTVVWDNTTSLTSNATYTCYPGYFVRGNVSVTQQQSQCLGVLGGWYPSQILPCIVVNVCNGTVPAPPTPPTVTKTSATNIRQLNSTINYTCPARMSITDGATMQMVTCMANGSSYGFFPPAVNACNVCVGEPVVNYTTTTWDNTTTYTVNMTVNITCLPNYVLNLTNTSQIINCTYQGWQTPQKCYQGCAGDPPTPGSNMTRNNVTSNAVGVKILYNCSLGYFIPTTMPNTKPVSGTSVVCSANSSWVPTNTPLLCAKLCLTDPNVTAPLNSSWDGFTRTLGTQVNISCPAGQVFPDLNTSVSISCGENGTWSTPPPGYLVCRTVAVTAPPAAPLGAVMTGAPPYWVGTSLNYTCIPPQSTLTGATYATVTYLQGGWTTLDPTFTCHNVCLSSPPSPPAGVIANLSNDIAEYGMMVTYTCLATNHTFTTTSTCNNATWTPATIPNCIDTNETAPTTEAPYTFPSTDMLSQAYSITTDFHLGDIYTLSDVNGAANNSETVAGPFGFGYAISLNGSKDQCVSDKNFASNNSCMYDPAQCTQGFSISIWERSNFSLQEFMGASNYQTFPLKYLVSTGGDDEGHPGVALYHQGIFLVGLVSTGTMYWKEMVVGAVYNDTWTNIALRWDPVNGLEGMINDRRVFYRQYGVNCTRLPPLNPPEIMIGCHKDSNNTVYRDFNTADLDELAIWQKRLPDNNTVFFLGGFEEDAKNLNPAKLDRILDGVDLTDPQQQIQAISALVAMTDPHNIQPVNASVNASSGVSASQLESFSTTLGLVQRLADPSSVPKCININDAPKSLGLVAALSNLMDTSRKQEWEAYQAQTGQDPLYYCKVLEPYLMAVAEALSCNNGTTRMGVHITVEHAHLQLDKLSIDDLSSMDNGFTSPVYTQQSYLSESWGQPREKVQVTGDIFADRRCLQRPINIITMLYENTHNVLQVPLKVNVEILDTPAVIELDSRVLGVTLNADQVLQSSGEVNPKMPKCEPDPNMLSSSPVLVTLMHRHSQFTMRKPLFHSNSSTDIVTRYCVWWNPDVGEAGGWDPSGCRIWYTNPQYTKCACQQTGMYAVLSQTIQTMSIPTEPSWLQTLRYVFYGLSAACLLLFILVVALSGELKEQFHLMGVTLALVLLAGSVFMVLTDLNSVRDTRHMCTAVGTLLHFLYLCAGAYVAMIGHATFDCVTSGIIGGRLQAYGCVGVGLTLISVGCAYTFFLQDLGNDPRCFISWSNFPKLLFFSPQVAFCCVGLFCAIVIFFNLHTASLRNNPSITDYRTFSLGASLFAVYFSLTWSIGVVSYLHLDLQIDFYPYFQILNGLMGVVLLLCLGACSSRFRMVLAGKAKRRREMLLNYVNKNNEKKFDSLDEPRPKPPPRPPTAPPAQVAGRPYSHKPSQLD